MCLLRRSWTPTVSGDEVQLLSGLSSLLEDVPGLARVDLHARAHGGGQSDRAEEAPLGGRRLRAHELVDLTKQISDARLVISGAQEEASARTRDLQAVDSRLKEENDRAAALQGQDQSLSAESTRLLGDADAARKALAEAQTQTASAQKEFEALQSQINAATAELNDLQAQVRAAKSATGANPNP